MNNKIAADLGCTLLTSMGMTQGNSVLFTLSLISTILGIILTIIRNVILPIYFKKKEESLSPEMGIAKWVNCENGEIPNSQPSQPLTKLEGSTTNS